MNVADTTETEIPPAGGRGLGRRAEQRLIAGAQAGSEEAIREIVERHWPRGFRAAYLILRDRHRAEEATQEAFVSAVDRLESFDASRPLGPWLHRIVVNRALDISRSEAVRPQAARAESAADGDAPSQVDEQDGSIASALAKLSPEDRAIVVMRYVLDYRAGEIGEVLGVQAETIRTRLHRAMQKLRTTLEATE